MVCHRVRAREGRRGGRHVIGIFGSPRPPSPPGRDVGSSPPTISQGTRVVSFSAGHFVAPQSSRRKAWFSSCCRCRPFQIFHRQIHDQPSVLHPIPSPSGAGQLLDTVPPPLFSHERNEAMESRFSYKFGHHHPFGFGLRPFQYLLHKPSTAQDALVRCRKECPRRGASRSMGRRRRSVWEAA